MSEAVDPTKTTEATSTAVANADPVATKDESSTAATSTDNKPVTETVAETAQSAADSAIQAATTAAETASTAATSVAETATTTATAAKDSVFAMFGGGAKKEKKEEKDDIDEPSGSSKKKSSGDDEDGEVEQGEDVHFEPVIRLTEKVEANTNEDREEQTFKMRAKLFKFDRASQEWKERGTGDVRLLKHKENGKTRLVMRRDKTHKVCANHYVVPGMKLSPNVGSDRSWVWNAAADVSEGEPEAQTLAIRFANAENANLFKDAFEQAQKENERLFSKDEA